MKKSVKVEAHKRVGMSGKIQSVDQHMRMLTVEQKKAIAQQQSKSYQKQQKTGSAMLRLLKMK